MITVALETPTVGGTAHESPAVFRVGGVRK
jgi:hypothetical protein